MDNESLPGGSDSVLTRSVDRKAPLVSEGTRNGEAGHSPVPSRAAAWCELVAPPRLLRVLSASRAEGGGDVVEDSGDVPTQQRHRADCHEGDEGEEQGILSQVLPLFTNQAIADPKNKMCHFSFLLGSCPLTRIK